MTRVPAVTAERSPPASRITGALSPVIAASLTEATPSIDLAVGGDEVAGLDQHDVADSAGRWQATFSSVSPSPLRRLAVEFGLGGAQRGRLRLAAPFGQRLGEGAEQHGQPEPDDQLELEAESRASSLPTTSSTVSSSATTAVVNITGLRISCARIELAEGVADRRNDQARP